MKYQSTRGDAPVLGFVDTFLAGLARDGGLYVPQTYPRFDAATIGRLAGIPYPAAAEAIMRPFMADEIGGNVLPLMLEAAYGAFRHPAVAPVSQIGDNLFLLELFHGPTLAFKDLAMQLLGRLMDHALKARGSRATIVGATSGDTGAAAIDAFRGLGRVDMFILYPYGRVSEVQRRQMTGIEDSNVHAIAIDGTFDDCQAILKALFNDPRFRDELALSGVNSINWARIVAQVVYYFTAAVALGAPHRNVAFSVPTGNFGDVLAGYIAKRMGLPIDRLTVATNANDILARTLATGRYELAAVAPTMSPSMDIQVSSNFERLLFDVFDRDPAAVRACMHDLTVKGGFTIEPEPLAAIRQTFDAYAIDEEATLTEMTRTYRDATIMLDPHTAIAVAAARKSAERDPVTPRIALATAHPAKFPDAVERATGRRPPLPAHLADLLERPERIVRLPNDVRSVDAFIREHSRVAPAKSVPIAS